MLRPLTFVLALATASVALAQEDLPRIRGALLYEILRVGLVAAAITVTTNVTVAITTGIVGNAGAQAIAEQMKLPQEAAEKRAAALAGDGILRATTFSVQDDVAAGRLVRVLPEWSLSESDIHALYPATAHLPQKVRVFIDALKVAASD